MSSNSDYAQGLVRINGRAYPAKELLKALERQAMTSIRIVDNELWIGKERIQSLTKISPEQAMRMTCYGSLAYCCELTRQCQLRDEALRLLGITKEEYHTIQNECHQQFLRYVERRWPQDQGSNTSHSPSYSRSQLEQESRDPWPEREYARSYGPTRDSSSSSRTGPTSTVDLGGLFEAPKEYASRSLTDPDPFHSSRISRESNSFISEGWMSSGSTAVAATPNHLPAPGFCIYCGQDLQEESEFCSRCGRNQK